MVIVRVAINLYLRTIGLGFRSKMNASIAALATMITAKFFQSKKFFRIPRKSKFQSRLLSQNNHPLFGNSSEICERYRVLN